MLGLKDVVMTWSRNLSCLPKSPLSSQSDAEVSRPAAGLGFDEDDDVPLALLANIWLLSLVGKVTIDPSINPFLGQITLQ